ncbi:hypothetical protein SESBI_17416 [Sesbania bispinosa]|nr:hypothetical protein SESBI_17416 [Sesbania bispinosa]
MEDPIGTEVVGVGSTNDANHRQVLTVRSGDGVDHAQSTDGERHDASSNAAAPRVTVGGVPGVELVAATNDLKLRLGDEVVQQREVEVAGNRENIGDANLDEPPARWRPKVASVGAGNEAEFWMVETVPFGGEPTSLLAGLHASRDPMFVHNGGVFSCLNENK